MNIDDFVAKNELVIIKVDETSITCFFVFCLEWGLICLNEWFDRVYSFFMIIRDLIETTLCSAKKERQFVHYENKFAKTLRPTDILQIFTKF